MDFHKHSQFQGTHAFLGASNHHWLNYSDDKLVVAYRTAQAAARGTRMHALARECIEMGQRLPDDGGTLSMYVNDAIGFGMTCEQTLFYSWNCYGTADTISFNTETLRLRIHDYKSGKVKTSERQLFVYAALFCLEYQYDPYTIATELRIYQNDEVRIYENDPDVIKFVMERIVFCDAMIEELKTNAHR